MGFGNTPRTSPSIVNGVSPGDAGAGGTGSGLQSRAPPLTIQGLAAAQQSAHAMQRDEHRYDDDSNDGYGEGLADINEDKDFDSRYPKVSSSV